MHSYLPLQSHTPHAHHNTQPPKEPAPTSNPETTTILGADFPKVTLPSGVRIQTGTMAGLLSDIRAYDRLVLVRGDSLRSSPSSSEDGTTNTTEEEEEEELPALEKRIGAAVSTLQQVGMFDLFRPEEWVGGAGSSAGRALVGRLAGEAGY